MSAGRELVRAIAAVRTLAGFAGRCAYCGARCNGRACPSHRDLVQLEEQLAREGA